MIDRLKGQHHLTGDTMKFTSPLRRANWLVAIQYINSTYFPGKQGVSYLVLMTNEPGRIEFRITREAVGTKDVYAYCRNALINAHKGVRHNDTVTSAKGRCIEFDLGEGRSVELTYVPSKGTFIRLKDKGTA